MNKNSTVLLRLASDIRKNVEQLPGVNKYLKLYCANASYMLYCVAKEKNLDVSIISGHFDINSIHNKMICNHAWIQYKDLIVDLTATQFGNFDEVHVTSITDPMYLEIFKNAAALDNFKYWPNAQNPLHPDSCVKKMPSVTKTSLTHGRNVAIL